MFGVDVDPLTMDETVDAVVSMVRCGLPHQHVCLNAAKVVELARNPELVEAIAACDLVNVDGQAVVWAARLLDQAVPERVAGIDLFERLLGVAAECELGVYLLGATADTVRDVQQVVTRRHPSLRIVGARDGYWQPEEEETVVREIAESRPDMLFVALPSPRKELFLERHAEGLGVPFRMGVGGSFDVVAGKTKRAPHWMRRAGVEWCYRLAQEPRRMFKRYLYGNTAFVLLTLREATGAQRRVRQRRARRDGPVVSPEHRP